MKHLHCICLNQSLKTNQQKRKKLFT